MRTDRLYEVGQELSVDLVRPGWKKQLTLTVRVTSRIDALDGRLSQRPPGLGLQFAGLTDEQHERLRVLLRELGAPEPEGEITLPDESSELELQALAIDVEADDLGPLGLQPQPLWQQVGPAEEAIRGALAGADWSPPDPPGRLSRPPVRPAPRSAPSEPPARVVALPPPAPAPPPTADLTAPGGLETARLMLQIRGLIMELSDAQMLLHQRDGELERLRAEVETMRAALARTARKT